MIVSYGIRNLVARGRTTLTAVFIVAATAAAITVILGLGSGLKEAISGPGHPGVVAIVARNAQSEENSFVPTAILPRIQVAPGVVMDGAKARVSLELVGGFAVRNELGHLESIRLRGVDPVAFLVHPEIKIASGAMPTDGSRGVVIGTRLLGRDKNFVEGGTIKIGRYNWTVVGTIRAPGEAAESEVWADRSVLMSALGSQDANVIYASLANPTDLSGPKSVVDKIRETELEVLTMDDLRKRSLAQATPYIDAIGLIVLVLCISAVFAGTNATYSMFLGQVGELATLLAIGYTRTRVALIVFVQSMLLAMLGGLLGVALALVANHHAFLFRGMSLIYEIHISTMVLAAGAAAATIIGIAGSIIAVIQTYQINVLTVLRE
jgi:putative ABC transport system permease protein